MGRTSGLSGEWCWRAGKLGRNLQQEANISVLLGLLALEEGDVDLAGFAFRLALSHWRDEATANSGGGIDFPGRPVAQGYLHLME